MDPAEILERCEEDRAACENATPGPWHVRLTDDDFYMNATYVGTEPDTGLTGHDGLCGMGGDAEPGKVVAIVLLQQPRLACVADGKWDENAAFIAHARTALERAVEDRRVLVERVRELEAENARLMDAAPFVPFGSLKNGSWFKWSKKDGAPIFQKVTTRKQGGAACNARVQGEGPYFIVLDDEQVIPVDTPDWKDW